MTINTHTTREGWLVDAIALLDTEFFKGRGHKLPVKLQVACGWPKAGGNRTVGQCWAPSASADETTQMYVSPTESEPVEVLDTLLHELIHDVDGCESGHKGRFKTMAKDFGFAGPMKSTYAAEGSPLKASLVGIAEALGPYPHAAMTKKDGARNYPYKWSRLMSETDNSYTVTISPRVMEEHGRPVDPWGGAMVDFVKGAN